MHMQFLRRSGVLALVGGAAIATGASAGVIEVAGLASPHAPASDLSLVPGGTPGFPTARFTNFNNRLTRTPTTNQWSVVATINTTPNTADQVAILGTGRTSVVIAQEGVTSHGLDINGQPEYINFSLLSSPRINDAGQWAIGFRPSGAATTDERLVTWNGSAFTVLKPGDAAPGGGTFTGGFSAANILNDGTPGYLASISPVAASQKSGVIGSNRLFEIFVTIPDGQAEPAVQYADIDSNLFYTNAVGDHWIVVGKVGIDAAKDRVVVLDGTVVIQKGSILPGSDFTSPVNTISTGNDGVWMESDGTWFAWGTNADGQSWMVRNGVVIAKSGQPITPGSTETWEGQFRAARGDNHGNWIINGNTNNPTLTDDVLVLNGQTVIARESDPVDLDGDGAFNDSLYVHLVQNHSVLMDDGYAYFVARLKSDPSATGGANGSNNASLLRVKAFEPPLGCGTSDYNGDGDFGTDADIEAFFACLAGHCCSTCFPGESDFNQDGDFGTDADIESFFRVLAGQPC